MSNFKPGNLIRLRYGVLLGAPIHGRVGLIIEITTSHYTLYDATYYKVLIDEDVYLFRSDEFEFISQ